MSTLSDVAIRVNKEEKFKINHEGKIFSIFEFIEEYFNDHLEPVKSTVFDGKKYFDYVMYDVSWRVDNPLVEIISNIANNSNVELCILEIVDGEDVFHTGDTDGMGLNYVKKNDFSFLEDGDI